LLGSHSKILSIYSEVFNPESKFDRSKYTEPQEFLSKVIFEKENYSAIVCKVLDIGLKRFWDDIWDIFAELDVQLIHTYRRNLLEEHLSLVLANANEAFFSLEGEYEQGTVYLHPKKCMAGMKWAATLYEDIRHEIEAHNLPVSTVAYEDLVSNEKKITSDLLRYLKLNEEPLTSRFVKQRKLGLANSIENYEELKKYFADTKWLQYFTE